MGAEYHAACDIGAFASCSKVLSSSYARILSHYNLVPRGSALDLSNALLGAVFYAGALVHDALPLPGKRVLMLTAAVGSLGFSGYLFYVLKFILNDFCLVCMGMYIANLVVFGAAVRRVVAPASGKKGTGKARAAAEGVEDKKRA